MNIITQKILTVRHENDRHDVFESKLLGVLRQKEKTKGFRGQCVLFSDDPGAYLFLLVFFVLKIMRPDLLSPADLS